MLFTSIIIIAGCFLIGMIAASLAIAVGVLSRSAFLPVVIIIIISALWLPTAILSLNTIWEWF